MVSSVTVELNSVVAVTTHNDHALSYRQSNCSEFYTYWLSFFCPRVTLGNQLDGIHLLDPEVVARFKKRYPDGVISKPKNMQWWL